MSHSNKNTYIIENGIGDLHVLMKICLSQGLGQRSKGVNCVFSYVLMRLTEPRLRFPGMFI